MSALRALLFLLLTSTLALVAQSSSTYPAIDGCGAAIQQDNLGNKNVEIQAWNVSSGSQQVKVEFIHCVLPDHMHVKIAIHPDATGKVMVEILNTTLQGGSLKVIPAGSSSWTVHNVEITVVNSTLETLTDAVVVDTRGSTTSTVPQEVQNVSITVRNAVLTSQSGNIASITTASGSEVSNVQVIVKGHSTLKTTNGFLVGSVVATKIETTTLLLDASGCNGSLTVVAGESTPSAGRIGALSVLPPTTTNSNMDLHLKDVTINVTDLSLFTDGVSTDCASSAAVQMEANVGSGVACVASICLTHSSNMALYITGTVSIDIMFKATSKNSTKHNSPPPHRLAARSSSSHSGSAVGGVLLASSTSKTPTNMQLVVQNCGTLRLSFKNTHTDPQATSSKAIPSDSLNNVTFSAITGELDTAACILGVASLARLTTDGRTNQAMTVSDGSTFMTSLALAGGGVHMATHSPGASATTVLGVALNAYASRGESSSTISVTNKSSFVIAGSIQTASNTTQQENTSVLLSSTSTGYLGSSAVLGITINGRSNGGSAATIFSVSASSRVFLTSSFSGSSISLIASTGNSRSVSAILGLSMYRFCEENVPLDVVAISSRSTFAVASSINGADIALASTTRASEGASALLAMVFYSRGDSVSVANTIVVSDSSEVSFASATAGANIALNASNSESMALTASGVVSVVLNGHCNGEAAATTTLDVRDGSRLTIMLSLRGRHVIVDSATTSTTVATVAASAGVAVLASSLDATSASLFRVQNMSFMSIESSLTNEAVVVASVPSGNNAVAAAGGIVVHGDGIGSFELKSASNIDVWVGASNNSQILNTSAASSDSVSVSTTIGLRTAIYSGLRTNNTNLSFCTDGTTVPTSADGLRPPRSTVSWPTINFGDDSNTILNCSLKVKEVENKIQDAQTIPPLLRSPPTATGSRSASSSLSSSVTASDNSHTLTGGSTSASSSRSGSESRQKTRTPTRTVSASGSPPTSSPTFRTATASSSSSRGSRKEAATKTHSARLGTFSHTTSSSFLKNSAGQLHSVRSATHTIVPADQQPPTTTVVFVPSPPPTSVPTTAAPLVATTAVQEPPSTQAPQTTLPPPPRPTTSTPTIDGSSAPPPPRVSRSTTKTMVPPPLPQQQESPSISKSFSLSNESVVNDDDDALPAPTGSNRSLGEGGAHRDNGYSCARGCAATAALGGAVVVVAAAAVTIVIMFRKPNPTQSPKKNNDLTISRPPPTTTTTTTDPFADHNEKDCGLDHQE